MFKKSELTFLLIGLFIFSNSFSQDRIIDSLKTAFQNPKLHDTTKLYIIATGMSVYSQLEPKFIFLNKQLAAKNYSKKQSPELKKKYAMYLATYYNNVGNNFGSKREVVKAVACYDKAISLFKFAEAYDEMNFTLISKGSFFSKINEYEKAITCLFTSLNYFEKHPKGNEDNIMYIMSTLASIYDDQGKHKESIIYNKKVIDHYSRQRNLNNEERNRKAMAYVNCGTSWFGMEKYAEAMESFNQALALFKKTMHPVYGSVTLTKMARVKMKQSRFDEAEALLNEALAGSSAEIVIASVNVKLGELFYLKKDLNKADHYLTEGLLRSKNAKILELQEQSSELLFKVSTDRKNFEKALNMYVFHDRLIDSSKTEASKNLLAQSQLKHEFEKKEFNYRLATQKKAAAKNNWLIVLSAALLFLLLGGYFYYRSIKQKQAITNLEKDRIKQRLLISQMNPHFIFNSIHNIRSLINNTQNYEAVNYLDKFSKLTRQILENSTQDYISLKEEIEMIDNYISIQQLLYQSKFNYKITCEDALDTESIFLPPMLTQPFIENAIKHGLKEKSANGMVEVHFYFKASKLFFEVIDNGKGFDGGKDTDNHRSMAMSITTERLMHYTKNKNFFVRTDNLTDEDQKVIGAKVVFEIPYIYEN